ncbi:MAG: hypothetical protein KDD89_05065 [Anaerolineales bacterium]|nr:hypothetical protein [Anaerolineales bacterium]
MSRRFLPLLALMGFYTAVVILLTWPLATHLNTHLVGPSSDAHLHYWNGWWVQTALAHGQNPFFTPLLNYPDGVNLATQNVAWFTVLPWLLLAPLFGGVVAYNLTIWLALVLCGLSAFALAHALTRHTAASVLAGLVYLAWPYRLTQLDHPNLVATFFMPLFILALWRLIHAPRWRTALLTGLLFALLGYTRWQLLIPAVLVGLVLALCWGKIWWPQAQKVVGYTAVSALFALILLLPAGFLLWQGQQQATADLLYEQDERTMQTDLLAYLTPAPQHPLWQRWTTPLYEQFYPDRMDGRRFAAYIGWTVLLLAGLGVVMRWREAWPWLVVAVLIVGLAAGPGWRIAGQIYDLPPTLYDLLRPLWLVRLMREPERFVMFLALPTAVLVAYGWAWFQTRFPRHAPATTLLASALILLDLAPGPAPLQFVGQERTFLADLAHTGEGALLNLPYRRRLSKTYMFEQTVHQRPILQGHISREPDNLYRFLDETDWLTAVPDLSADPLWLMNQLHTAGIAHVLLHRDLLPPEQVAVWQAAMPYPPQHADETYLLYATRPDPAVLPAPRPVSLCPVPRLALVQSVPEKTTAVLRPETITCPPSGVSPTPAGAVFGDVIQLVGYELTPRADTDAALDLTFYWLSRAYTPQDLTLFVHLLDESGQIVTQHDAPPAWGQNPTSGWQVGDLYSETITLTAVASGNYQVALGWYEATTGDRLAITNHPQQTDNRALLPETVRLQQPNQP